MQWRRDSFVFSTDRSDDAVRSTLALLQATYWGHKRSLEIVEKILQNSMCFFLICETDHVGFARVITDFATTSWICDVAVNPDHQNCGLGSWMMDCVMQHPELAATQFVLQTGTAHEFYRRLGFFSNNALMSTPVDYL